jgi:hypothetical protein
MWELWTGEPPFKGINKVRLAAEIAYQGAVLDLERLAGSPKMYKELVAACFKENPEERPTFEQILAQLQVLANTNLLVVAPLPKNLM